MQLKERLNLLSRDTEYITKTQVEFPKIKNSVSEMKNTLGGINSRLDIAENKISKYEGIAIV